MIQRILIFTVSLFGLAGCSDFLDVVPKDKQTEQQLYSTPGGFYTAVNGVYNNLASNDLYGRQLSYEMIEFLGNRYTYNFSQNLYFTALNAATKNYAQENVENALARTWRTAYSTILNCNVIIDNAAKQDGVLSPRQASLITGEMLAIRAFLHFDILRLFGPVYKSDPDMEAIPYNESAKILVLPFLSCRQVLEDKILVDIDRALELLAGNDPVIEKGPLAGSSEEEDTQLTYRQLRFNYYAVLALKARVLLYGGNGSGALEVCRQLLGDPVFTGHFPPVDPNLLLSNSINPDRVFSSEVLAAIYKKDRSTIYTTYFDPENSGDNNFLQPRNYLLTDIFAAETEDYRYQAHWTTITTPGRAGHGWIKYKEIKKPANSDADYYYATMMALLRLSELYYIAAETEPDLTEGYRWLNDIRRMRGMTADLPVDNREDLMKRITNEYIREFAGEGQVFYYYKRLALDMPAEENGSRNSGSPFYAPNYVCPIPAEETDNR